MSSGERPIGAAKGKQSDTEALCQTPPRGLQPALFIAVIRDSGLACAPFADSAGPHCGLHTCNGPTRAEMAPDGVQRRLHSQPTFGAERDEVRQRVMCNWALCLGPD